MQLHPPRDGAAHFALAVLASLISLFCCACAPDEAPPTGHKIAFEPPPEVDLTKRGYRQAEDGTLVLGELQGAELRFDPKRTSPYETKHACRRWVTTCYSSGKRAMDDCFASVPICRDKAPWKKHEKCCLPECQTEYVSRRKKGTEAITAALDAVDVCFEKDIADDEEKSR